MLEETLKNLTTLKLNGIINILNDSIEDYNKNNISFLEAINKLLKHEIEFREINASKNNVHVSHFPFIKEISDFDFEFQPTINKKEILDLSTLRFIEEKENIIFLGPSGVGKTHLAVSLGIIAAKKRNSVYFISCNDLINNLTKAYNENRAEERIKHYNKYKLLIIDEIGYLPVDSNGANLLFQLIAKRYEKKSTIITTNQSFDKWPELFKDPLVANAMLDRLVHHSTIINIKGESYRTRNLKNKKIKEES